MNNHTSINNTIEKLKKTIEVIEFAYQLSYSMTCRLESIIGELTVIGNFMKMSLKMILQK